MFGLTIVSGVPLIAGLLEGMNRRTHSQFQPDPWASYKVMSLTGGVGFVKIISQYDTPVKSTIRQLAVTGLIGAPLVAGMMYCMGIQLTKIPHKDLF